MAITRGKRRSRAQWPRYRIVRQLSHQWRLSVMANQRSSTKQPNHWLIPVMTLLSLVCVPRALAVTITWTGGAGTNAWGTPANWNLNRVPGAGDDVVIPVMSPHVTVTYSSTTTPIN